MFPIGGIIGPNVGGWVIDHFGWRAIFSVNLPIGVTLFVLGIFLLPRSEGTRGAHRIDVLGAASFGLGIVGLMYGMTVWGNDVNFSLQVALWVVLGLGSLVLFVRHEGRSADPMIEIRLLKERAFLAANLYNFLYGGLVFGFFSFVPLYATLAYKMSATDAGFILTPRAIAMISMSIVSSFLLIRIGYRLPMIVGIVLISVGLYLFSQGWHNPIVFGGPMSNLLLLSLLIAITGFGVGIGGPAANNAAIELITEAVARITGLRGMFRNTGGVLSTAVIILILAHYPNQARGLQEIFRGLSFLVLLVIPPIFLIPDNARLRRQAAQHVKAAEQPELAD